MKIGVVAPAGNMGSAIVREVLTREDMKLVGALGRPGSEYIGEDVGFVARAGSATGILVAGDYDEAFRDSDVLIDFSNRETSLATLEYALKTKKAFVCGTTGFTREEKERFSKAAQEIPVLPAANTSRMVFVFREMMKLAAKTLPQADLEILDKHSRSKKDAPSGTALEFAEDLADIREIDADDVIVYGRRGQEGTEKGKIGMHSLRMGNVPSSHTVYFGQRGERIELVHHVYDMEPFAIGAVDAAVFLYERERGLYHIEDVFGS